MSRVQPVVGPDGQPYYVLTRQPIGAEHLNAATAWAQRQHAASLREHARDASHSMPYHCIAALRVRMPIWDQNYDLWREGEIRGDSQFFAWPDGIGKPGRQFTLDQWEDLFGSPAFDFAAQVTTGEALLSPAASAVEELFGDRTEIVVHNNAVPAYLGGNRGVFYLQASMGALGLLLKTAALGTATQNRWDRTAANRDFLVSLFLR